MRLMTWLSPAFPVGSFAYSHGLETAYADGLLKTRDDLKGWLSTLIAHGSGWNDAVLCAASWRAPFDATKLQEIAELGAALAGSRERFDETTLQGVAFIDAARPWLGDTPPAWPADCPLPVAIGAVAGRCSLPLHATVAACLQAFLGNLVQAVLRLGRHGQSDGVTLLAGLEELVLKTAHRAAASTLDDLGTAAFASEIMALRHETLETRIFLS